MIRLICAIWSRSFNTQTLSQAEQGQTQFLGIISWLSWTVNWCRGCSCYWRQSRSTSASPYSRQLAGFHSFSGLLNYYEKFLPNLATTASGSGRRMRLCISASQGCSHHLPSAGALWCLKPLKLAVNASSYDVGVVITYIFANCSERPIAFVSRPLMPSERNYPQLEKGALARVFRGKNSIKTFLDGTSPWSLTIRLCCSFWVQRREFLHWLPCAFNAGSFSQHITMMCSPPFIL